MLVKINIKYQKNCKRQMFLIIILNITSKITVKAGKNIVDPKISKNYGNKAGY